MVRAANHAYPLFSFRENNIRVHSADLDNGQEPDGRYNYGVVACTEFASARPGKPDSYRAFPAAARGCRNGGACQVLASHDIG